jgi:hypothetical protein
MGEILGSRQIAFFICGGAVLLTCLFPSGVPAQSSDFFSSTNRKDLRGGNSPGFDPCAGGNREAGGACGGPATGLLKPANLSDLFPSLGPGAITHNMWGIINNRDAEGRVINTAVCQLLEEPPFVLANGMIAGLNCGNLLSDPTVQGQTIPGGENTLNSPFGSNVPMEGDFSPESGAHMGILFSNAFAWDPGGGNARCPDAPAGPAAPAAVLCSQQGIEQVTALASGGIGTFAQPGLHDQHVRFTTSWTTEGNTATLTPEGNTVTVFKSPLIRWRQTIWNPPAVGDGEAFFLEAEGGFFYEGEGEIHVDVFGPDGRILFHNGEEPEGHAASFGCGPLDQGCASYPTGRTQTIRSGGGIPQLDPDLNGDGVPDLFFPQLETIPMGSPGG